MPHLQSQAVPQHISATRKVCFIKFGVGFWNSELVFIQGHPGNDCFLWNICSEMQKLPRIFYSLRKAENLYMTVPFMYNFQSLSNKIPMRLSQDGFWWFHLLFRSGFVCSVLFSRLNSQWAKKKMYSSKGIISLWSALSLFLRYKLKVARLDFLGLIPPNFEH